MRSLLVLWLLMMTPGLVPVLEGAALGSNEVAAARGQGSNSLAVFQRLITPSNFQLMGFGSMLEVPNATNAEPLLIYTLPLNRLTNYLAGGSFSALLFPDPQTSPAPVTKLIVPVMVGTDVRSSLSLRLVQDVPGQPVVWTNAGWGRPKVIRNLMTTYNAVPNAALQPGTTPFVVEIPVFDLWLIGYQNQQNDVVLLATANMKLGPVTVNQAQAVPPAAMQQLSYTATRYNGLPN